MIIFQSKIAIKKIILILFSITLLISYSDYSIAQDKGRTEYKKKKQRIKKKHKVKKSKSIKKLAKKKSVIKNKIATNILNPDDDSMSGTLEWSIVINDDNGNIELPERFRTWWYVRLDGINKKAITTLHINGDGFPGKSVVLPVYSYDRINWHRLKPEELTIAGGENNLHYYTIQKRFDSSNTVWLARYYPYSVSRLNNFIKSIRKNPYTKVEEIGKSTRGRPMYMITITDFKVNDKNKKRIWIHARTHPSETGGSYFVEGLIKYLISDCNVHCDKADLSKLIFNIVPMVNIDGVANGNARVTPDSSYDLERMWFRKSNNYDLRDTCPPEVKAIHSAITRLIKKGPEFLIALNIHSKNAPPNWRPFIYSNFRRKNNHYGAEGDTLFKRQLNFAKIISNYYCGDTINVRNSEEIANDMNKKLYPEAWWWLNFKDKVMAATLETTSGYNGCFEAWVNYQDQMKLGEAVAKACYQYYKYYVSKEYFRYERPCEDIQELLKFHITGFTKK